MDSQEAAGNAAKSASDHGRNVVKSNPLLPPGFRARPQGPPGSPRHPLNNGPIGQSRLEGQPQQIGYDVRPPFGPPSSPQFAQHGPHEPPRPLGNLLAQRPPQQGQNPPILLNPRFPAPPPVRISPQQRPRLLNPGNYQAQQFQRSSQQPHRTGPEHQNVPPEVRSPEGLIRPQQIAQRPLQRNESLLSIPRPRLPFPKEEKTPTPPRIIVERMADVDNARKSPQLENSKDKMRENAENDDDDDVVTDGKKSPRPGSGLSNQRELIDSKSPKKDLQSKEAVDKSKDSTVEKVSASENHRSDKSESQLQEPVKDANSRLPSAKSDEKTHVEVVDRAAVEKVDHKSDKPVEKAVEDTNATEKAGLSKDCARKPSSPSIPPFAEDKSRESDTSGETTQSKLPSEELSSERSLKASAESGNKAQSTSLEEDQRQREEKSKSPSKSEKGHEAEVRASPSVEATQGQQDLKIPEKSPDKSRASTPAENSAVKNEGELQVSSKTPDRSPVSTPEIKRSQSEKKVEGQDTSADESRRGQELNESNINAESKDAQVKQEEAKLDSKLESKQEKSPEKTHANLNDSLKAEESKDPVDSATNQLPIEKPTAPCGETYDKLQEDEIDQSSLEVHTNVSSGSPTVTKETSRSPNELLVTESVLSSPKSPASVKGFDNGQRRSLSVKLSPRSPRSPTSPTSPSRRDKVVKEESKKTTFDENSISQRTSAPKIRRTATPAKLSPATPDLENGSATNGTEHIDTTPTSNGVSDSPMKKSPSKSKDSDKLSTAGSPVKSPSKSVKSLPRTPETPSSTGGQDKKKVPMNKVQVGSAPSPNLKTVRSKIGSLENASYKPGGGKVKIENRKLDFSKAQPKIAAKNEKYTPSGGDKKISQVKLQWNAKSKIGSLENATYKPGGGDKKIETVKLDFKDKAKPKVGSKDNAKHVPGGGGVKSSATPPKTPQDSTDDIQTQKIDIKAESKIGSMDNVKHKPGGGDKKIFNDKDYLRQTGSNVESLSGSGSQIESNQEMTPSSAQQIQDVPQPPPTTPTKAQKLVSPTSAMIPKAVSNLAKSSETTYARNGIKKSPNSENDKNMTQNKTTKLSGTSKSPSSKKLRLPKLVTSSAPQETTSISETHSNVTLPKLIEPSTELTRVVH